MSRRARTAVAVVALMLVSSGGWFVGHAAWANARDWTPLDVPLSLVDGARFDGEVRIDRDGDYAVEVTVPREEAEAAQAIRAGLHDLDVPPARVPISFELLRGDRVVASGSSATPGYGSARVRTLGVLLASFSLRAGVHELRARVRAPDDSLRTVPARLLVEVRGDAHTNAWIEAEMAPVAGTWAGLGALALLVLFLTRPRPRRGPPGGDSPK